MGITSAAEVDGDDRILTVATNRGRLGVGHDPSRGTTVVNHCNAGSCSQRAALTTSFMHQVANAYIREACDELREDGETSPKAGAFRRSRDDGDAGGRNNNRGA